MCLERSRRIDLDRATYTRPFATTGTLLLLPPVLGHLPAAPKNKVSSAVPVGLPLKAYRVIVAGLGLSGRDTAQMIGSSSSSEETLVKNPPSWPPPRLAEVPSFVKVNEGDVLTFQVITFEPPLLTMGDENTTAHTSSRQFEPMQHTCRDLAPRNLQD